MKSSRKNTTSAVALLLLLACAPLRAATPLDLLAQLNDYPHAQTISLDKGEELDYEIGLGAMQKIGGAWKFKHSERFNGTLTSYSWQIVDGFTSIEVMEELLAQVASLDGAQLLFSCDGRDCGQGVQWANRVFHKSVLYGQEALQRYRVYSIGAEPRNLLLVYASARTADRQYLHAEVLEVH
ncbi:MAG: DUF4892 domain-containing protein [Gammaproteobacteria bacterium]|jgi:hypothetical protein|nr:DUF4892 domain-containing protein [Gammaproteobacteria bacterium]